MSQADVNSNDGDNEKLTTTGTGCYKNYDHSMRRKNSRIQPVQFLDVDDFQQGGAVGSTREQQQREQPGDFPFTTTATSATHPNAESLPLQEFKGKTWASVDSCDTYASCQTHPFMSQEELEGPGGPGPRPSTSSSAGQGAKISPWGSPRRVKRGVSVDGEGQVGGGSSVAGVRRQQSSKSTSRPSTKEDCCGGGDEEEGEESSPSASTPRPRPSFLPTGIVCATKLINQHLFGTGQPISPSDPNRRSSSAKPILKQGSSSRDPETERLIGGGSVGGGRKPARLESRKVGPASDTDYNGRLYSSTNRSQSSTQSSSNTLSPSGGSNNTIIQQDITFVDSSPVGTPGGGGG